MRVKKQKNIELTARLSKAIRAQITTQVSNTLEVDTGVHSQMCDAVALAISIDLINHVWVGLRDPVFAKADTLKYVKILKLYKYAIK